MELRVIEDDMLRVMLTRLDMIKYDIDCKSLDYHNTKTRKAVWEILDEAYKKTGFDAGETFSLFLSFGSTLGCSSICCCHCVNKIKCLKYLVI